MQTTFLDLPDDLLLDLFEDFPISTLFALASSCRRLRFPFLLAYIKKRGVADPEDRCVASISSDREDHDLVAALVLSPWIAKTRYFECTFPANKVPLKTMLHHFDRVGRLISRFTSVDEVVLKFADRKQHLKAFSSQDIAAWSDSISRLLNTIIERGCTSLQVSGLVQMSHVYKATYKPPSKSLFSLKSVFKKGAPVAPPAPAKFSLLSGENWTYERVDNDPADLPLVLPTISPQAQAQSRLTRFTIGSESLLTPPLLQWAYSVLSTSPITTVVIRDILGPDQAWDILLPIILPRAIPGLKRLELVNIGFFSKELLCAFLNAFPALEYFSIDHPIGTTFPFTFSKSGKLEYDTLKVDSPSFPHLTELRIALSWLRIDRIFDLSKASVPALKSLTFLIPQGTALYGGPSPTVPHVLLAKLCGLGSNLHFEVNLEFRAYREAQGDIVMWMQNQQNQPAAMLDDRNISVPWIECVTGVGLTLNYKLTWGGEKESKACAEQWFGRFPGLRRVTVRSDVRNSEEVENSIEEFCQVALIGLLDKLEKVEVNGKVWTGLGI